jgi:hypothetical protein
MRTRSAVLKKITGKLSKLYAKALPENFSRYLPLGIFKNLVYY